MAIVVVKDGMIVSILEFLSTYINLKILIENWEDWDSDVMYYMVFCFLFHSHLLSHTTL